MPIDHTLRLDIKKASRSLMRNFRRRPTRTQGSTASFWIRSKVRTEMPRYDAASLRLKITAFRWSLARGVVSLLWPVISGFQAHQRTDFSGKSQLPHWIPGLGGLLARAAQPYARAVGPMLSGRFLLPDRLQWLLVEYSVPCGP